MFIIMLSLYNILELGNYQFNTYYKHHVKNLQIKTFTYNSCLLIMLKDNHVLGIIKMQTNNTLIFRNVKFLIREQMEIDKAKFLTKLIQILNPTSLLMFNNCIIIINKESFYMSQKGQGVRIKLVNIASKDYKQAYMKQRARGAYLATIC